MPRTGMEPRRREALVAATIAEIGHAGSLDVTVGQIARRAGMSSALAHHYFGGKDQIFLAAMRHILREYSGEVLAALTRAKTPRARLDAILKASFAASCFAPVTISAWMSFYGRAQSDDAARRLLILYHRRLRSNLIHALRPISDAPQDVAEALAALIDGLYLRASLADLSPQQALGQVSDTASRLLKEQP